MTPKRRTVKSDPLCPVCHYKLSKHLPKREVAPRAKRKVRATCRETETVQGADGINRIAVCNMTPQQHHASPGRHRARLSNGVVWIWHTEPKKRNGGAK